MKVHLIIIECSTLTSWYLYQHNTTQQVPAATEHNTTGSSTLTSWYLQQYNTTQQVLAARQQNTTGTCSNTTQQAVAL